MWSSATVCPFILLVLPFTVSAELACEWQDEPGSVGREDLQHPLIGSHENNIVYNIDDCKLRCEAYETCVAINYQYPLCNGFDTLQITATGFPGRTYSIKSNCTQEAAEEQEAVGFYARVRDNQGPYNDGATVRFDNVITNKGDAYNPENGYFTASVPGLYLFYFSLDACHSDVEKVSTGVLRVNNGNMVARARTGYKQAKSIAGATRATLLLNSGQTVRVENHEGGSVYCKNYTTFSGVLIASTED